MSAIETHATVDGEGLVVFSPVVEQDASGVATTVIIIPDADTSTNPGVGSLGSTFGAVVTTETGVGVGVVAGVEVEVEVDAGEEVETGVGGGAGVGAEEEAGTFFFSNPLFFALISLSRFLWALTKILIDSSVTQALNLVGLLIILFPLPNVGVTLVLYE